MIVQELLTRLGFTVDKAGIERGKSALNEFKSFAVKLGIGAGIALLGREAFDTATQMEDLNVQFKTLLGSQEQATKMMGDVTKFAAQTPYELPELANATKKLIAYGIANEKIMPTLNAVGDIAAGLKIPINDLADIYGKARVQGTLMSEDINQMTGRGIPIIQEFAKQFHVSESKIKEMASKGKIHFKDLELAFKNLTGKGGKFNGMMEELSKTTMGKLSTAMDNVKMAAAQMLTPFLKFVKQGLDAISAINFQPMIDFFQKAAVAVEYLATVIWNSGLQVAFIALYDTVMQVMSSIADATGTTGDLGATLLTVGRAVGFFLTMVVMAASTVVQFTGWVIELVKWMYVHRDIMIGLGVVMAALFGPAMVARILTTGGALRIAALANLFFQRAALAGGAAAGYQVTVMGMLKAATFGVGNAFRAAIPAVRAFGVAMIGTMGLVFAAVASVGFAVYRIWQAISEKRELETRMANEEQKSKIAEQILEDTKEMMKARRAGDRETEETFKRRIAERRRAYAAIGESAKADLEENSFPSFDAMMQASTGKLDVMMQKTTEAGSKVTNVTNNMDFTVNADSKDGKTGLTADQIAELAARAARATFNIELQRVSVGML